MCGGISDLTRDKPEKKCCRQGALREEKLSEDRAPGPLAVHCSSARLDLTSNPVTLT